MEKKVYLSDSTIPDRPAPGSKLGNLLNCMQKTKLRRESANTWPTNQLLLLESKKPVNKTGNKPPPLGQTILEPNVRTYLEHINLNNAFDISYHYESVIPNVETSSFST